MRVVSQPVNLLPSTAASAPALQQLGWGWGGVRTGQLEHLGGEILEDRGGVNGGLCADADVVLRALLEVPVYTADGELSGARGKTRVVSVWQADYGSQSDRTSS